MKEPPFNTQFHIHLERLSNTDVTSTVFFICYLQALCSDDLLTAHLYEQVQFIDKDSRNIVLEIYAPDFIVVGLYIRTFIQCQMRINFIIFPIYSHFFFTKSSFLFK